MSGNIFDEKILKTQAFSFLHEFLVDIIAVFPEYKEPIVEKYNPFLSRDQERIQGDNQEKCDIAMEFINNLSKYTKQITDKDDSMFADDLYLLNKVNFKDIWCSKISDATRGKIWNYLQTFSMLSITINSNKDLTKIMSSLNNIVKGEASETENSELNAVINNLKKLSTSLTKGDDGDDDGEPPVPDLSGEGVEDKFNTFFSGSKIGDLAKEIAGDLNVEKMVAENKGNPEDLLKSLFSGGGTAGAEGGGGKFNIMNVVENISSKINKKITDGEIKEDDLMKEAQNMMSSMQGNSLFGNLFNQTSAAMGKSGGAGAGAGEGTGAAVPDISGMLNMLGGLGGGAAGASTDAAAPDISGMLNMLGGGGGGGGDGAMPDISGMLNMLGAGPAASGGGGGDGGEPEPDLNSILGIGQPSRSTGTRASASSDRNVAARQRLQQKLKDKKDKR